MCSSDLAHVVSFFPGAVEFDRETNLIIIHPKKGAPVISGLPNSESYIPYISMAISEFEEIVTAANKTLGLVLSMAGKDESDGQAEVET